MYGEHVVIMDVQNNVCMSTLECITVMIPGACVVIDTPLAVVTAL